MEIEFCKNISDYVRQLNTGEDLKAIKHSLNNKARIIELLQTSLVQSKKLGEDVSELTQRINQMKQEYNELEALYEETLNSSRCATEW